MEEGFKGPQERRCEAAKVLAQKVVVDDDGGDEAVAVSERDAARRTRASTVQTKLGTYLVLGPNAQELAKHRLVCGHQSLRTSHERGWGVMLLPRLGQDVVKRCLRCDDARLDARVRLEQAKPLLSCARQPLTQESRRLRSHLRSHRRVHTRRRGRG